MARLSELDGPLAVSFKVAIDVKAADNGPKRLPRSGSTYWANGKVPVPLVHSIGIDQYDQPEAFGRVTQGDFVIEDGMMVNFETGYFELGWGMLQLEDTYHVQDDGVERLSTRCQ